MTANGKYSLHYRKSLPQHIQMQLSRIRETFSKFVATFLKFTLIFSHFEKKE